MIVRPATEDDLEAVGALHALSRRHAYADLIPPDALAAITDEAMIADWRLGMAQATEDHRVVVAVLADGTLAGFSMITVRGAEAELNAIHVHPDQHGTGVAGALLDTVLAIMREAGCTSTYLWVLEGNERAQAFYRRTGWTFDGTRSSHEIGGHPAEILRYSRAV
jgi:ribosomal protein S18 acetylase RimI-like enzyme